MTFRKIVSLSIALSFAVLFITGILSYFIDYSRALASIHTVFGFVFGLGIVLHVINNLKPLKRYFSGAAVWGILLIGILIFFSAYGQISPVKSFMDIGAKLKANSTVHEPLSNQVFVEMDLSNAILLSIDLVKGEHYWHPQMAIWTEDMEGNYLETLFVSKATAKGLFFGGRTKDNFKMLDENNSTQKEYRRVNALPVWSHKRGVLYEDGELIPTRENPLPEAISGETISDNFYLRTSTQYHQKFRLKLELNVAFDDNEYYSEFDFPDDDIYHNGTGQLGQPSIVFQSIIDMNDSNTYYLMKLAGHGHHSARTGIICQDRSTLTTALEIVERIVVGAVNKPASE